MKKCVFFSLLLALIAGIGAAQDASSVVDASRNRIKADTVFSQSRMVIANKNGSTSERVLDQYSSDDATGNSRTVIIFQKPAAVAGTRFLTLEVPGKNDLRWIYLPARKTTRQIAADQGSGSFVGTDFTYDDISSASRSVALDAHRFLPEESLLDQACQVIESVPKDKGYQYSRMISWISKATQVALRIDLYDAKGNLAKRLETMETKDIQGRLTATATKMTSLAAQTSTTVYVDAATLRYDDPIPDARFTKEFIDTGRLP
jgi:hypothetical protein